MSTLGRNTPVVEKERLPRYVYCVYQASDSRLVTEAVVCVWATVVDAAALRAFDDVSVIDTTALLAFDDILATIGQMCD